MAPEQTEHLRLVDPSVLGRRLRAARETAALDLPGLAALAGTSAIHLADVEAGRARPTLRVLGALAEHTGTTPELLVVGLPGDVVLDLRRDLDLAALGLAATGPAPARAAADRVLDLLATATVPDLERAARRLRATALETAGDLAGAVDELRRVSAVPVPEVGWILDLISLSRCLRELGRLDEAIAVGEEAEADVRRLGLAETTEAVRLTVSVAAGYLFRGDVRHGARLCRRAAAAADQHRLPVAKAAALWNRSIALDANGDPDAGLPLALDALAILEGHRETRLVARVRTYVATLQLTAQPADLDGALAMLERARAELDRAGAPAIDVARHRLCAARVHYGLGDDLAAARLLDESEALTPAVAPELRAWQSALRGRLAAGRGDVHRTREHFLAAVHTLTGTGADKDAAQVWFELGETLTRLGEDQLALQAFRSAGVSQGLRVPALTTAPGTS